MKDLSGFEEIIGYKFKDTELLRQALSHSSYANILVKKALENGSKDNASLYVKRSKGISGSGLWPIVVI